MEEREKNKNDKLVLSGLNNLPFPAKTLANLLKDTKKQNLYGVRKN